MYEEISTKSSWGTFTNHNLSVTGYKKEFLAIFYGGVRLL